MTWITRFFTYIFQQMSSMNIIDIIDILIVAVLLYYIINFIRDRRAGKLAVGIVFLVLSLILSEIVGMTTLNFIMKNILQVGILAVIIIFQPELRSILEKMGGNSLRKLTKITGQKDEKDISRMVNEIAGAVSDMSRDKTGALIILENTTKLGDEIKSGVIVDAQVSSFLIKNIFFNKAPLHDGAMIIRDGRIIACGCFLPLSSNSDIIKDLGTRHRAALGMSEQSDALVIVVSEENGIISVAKGGQLIRNFDKASLTEEISEFIKGGAPSNNIGKQFRSKILAHGEKKKNNSEK